jgi:DNA uptake protein ComE-like DNA-binding protein
LSAATKNIKILHYCNTVINMNTATMEELMKIKDIGETRSKLIIKAQ